MTELNYIQTNLVAPKNQKNGFGNYNYRNLEGILEALKPLLKEKKCTITFTDNLVNLGERLFCESTATLKNEKGEFEQSTSFAELDAHKGMSKEQSSGSASSYARKYAICSLLAIDDNADPDSLDNRESSSTTRTDNNPSDNVRTSPAPRTRRSGTGISVASVTAAPAPSEKKEKKVIKYGTVEFDKALAYIAKGHLLASFQDKYDIEPDALAKLQEAESFRIELDKTVQK